MNKHLIKSKNLLKFPYFSLYLYYSMSSPDGAANKKSDKKYNSYKQIQYIFDHAHLSLSVICKQKKYKL